MPRSTSRMPGSFAPSAERSPTRRSSRAVCCAASYQWSIGGGTVPPGLALNSDGVLSGTPTAPGTYTFLVRVEDPNAAIYGQRQFTLSVVTSLLQITGTSMLSRAFVGHPYIGMLTATGGDAPLTWT